MTGGREFMVANAFGAATVAEDEARAVFEAWPSERRTGDLQSGFEVWDVSEPSGTVLMATRYTPLDAAA